MFGFKKKDEKETQKISKEYELINVNQDIIKKYIENNKNMLYVSLVSYQENTKIHVYNEEQEIIGDIQEQDIPDIINLGFKSGIIFLKKYINDSTGLIEYTTGKLLCNK